MLDALTTNWPLKLLALALAFAIWVVVTGEQQVVRDVSVPLDIQLPETRILTQAPLTNVTVRLRGAESRVRRLDAVDMEVVIDLLDIVPGEVDVQISADDLDGVPPGVEVDFIEPDRLKLEIDSRKQRELRVEPVFAGQPPEGFVFYGARVDPRLILVDGAETEIENLTRVETNPIRLEMRRQPFTVRVGAVPEGSSVRLVDPTPVEVTVAVDEAPVERKLEGLPIELISSHLAELVDEPAPSIVLTGPPRLIGRIQASQIRLIADTNELTPRKRPHDVGLSVRFIDLKEEDLLRLSVKTISPPTVTVRIAPVAGDEDAE